MALGDGMPALPVSCASDVTPVAVAVALCSQLRMYIRPSAEHVRQHGRGARHCSHILPWVPCSVHLMRLISIPYTIAFPSLHQASRSSS